MLVLSRKLGEKIHIGNDIIVTVTEIHGNRVRLSFEAPNDVRILRSELATWVEPTPEPKPEVTSENPWVSRGTTDPSLLFGKPIE